MFTPMQQDYLKELFNIGLGNAANELSELVGEEVLMSVPEFRLISRAELLATLAADPDEEVTMVTTDLEGGLQGSGMLLFPYMGSIDLARLISDYSHSVGGITELEEEALSEIAGIVLNGIITTLSNMLSMPVRTGMPGCSRASWRRALLPEGDGNGAVAASPVLFLGMHFAVRSLDLKGDILFLQEYAVVERLVERVQRVLVTLGLAAEVKA